MIDETHDIARRSWVPGADGHPHFPIQNLPLGIFRPRGGAPRGGVAIGDSILEIASLLEGDALPADAREVASRASGPVLNPFLALDAGRRRDFRRALSQFLAAENAPAAGGRARVVLHDARDCTMELPAAIGDYTDFYAGIHHATNVGRLFRPESPLLPNYKHVPIGYHGRASSVRPSFTPVRRPSGQRKPPNQDAPDFGPSRNLDYELELGVWVGPGNALGSPIAIAGAGSHIAGLCLLNDWSARDLQSWEYQPLGPFLAKSFLTTVSPWVITAEALEPFRVPQTQRPAGDPAPLPYLWSEEDQRRGAFSIDLEVFLSTAKMREERAAPVRLSKASSAYLYWTAAQLLAHHTSNGCNLNPGDLLGTGTISAPTADGFGSLLELTQNGRAPIDLGNGEKRTFLQDGDEISFQGVCRAPGFATIGFGECRGRIEA